MNIVIIGSGKEAIEVANKACQKGYTPIIIEDGNPLISRFKSDIAIYNITPIKSLFKNERPD